MADAKKTSETPLGWLVVLMFILLQAAEVMVEDIDNQIRSISANDGFDPKKKYYLRNYFDAMKKARHWIYNMLDIDGIIWGATDANSKRYSNVIADANEIIRVLMYYLDRAHAPGAHDKIVHLLRAMPTNGLFAQDYIDRFNMEHEWVFMPGDRIHSESHGDGTLDFNTTGDNWNIRFDDGTQTILSEKQFQLI